MANEEELRLRVTVDGPTPQELERLKLALRETGTQMHGHVEKVNRDVRELIESMKKLGEVMTGISGPSTLLAMVGRVGLMGTAIAAGAGAAIEVITHLREASREMVTMSQRAAQAGMSLAQYRLEIENLKRANIGEEQAGRNIQSFHERIQQIRRQGGLMEELFRDIHPGTREGDWALKFQRRLMFGFSDENEARAFVIESAQELRKAWEQGDPSRGIKPDPGRGAIAEAWLLGIFGMGPEMGQVRERAHVATQEEIKRAEEQQKIFTEFFKQTQRIAQAWEEITREWSTGAMAQLIAPLRALADALLYLAENPNLLKVLALPPLLLVMPGNTVAVGLKELLRRLAGVPAPEGATAPQHFASVPGLDMLGDDLDKALELNTAELRRLNEILALAGANALADIGGGGDGAATFNERFGQWPTTNSNPTQTGPEPSPRGPAPNPDSSPTQSGPESPPRGPAPNPSSSPTGSPSGFAPSWLAPGNLGVWGPGGELDARYRSIAGDRPWAPGGDLAAESGSFPPTGKGPAWTQGQRQWFTSPTEGWPEGVGGGEARSDLYDASTGMIRPYMLGRPPTAEELRRHPGLQNVIDDPLVRMRANPPRESDQSANRYIERLISEEGMKNFDRALAADTKVGVSATGKLRVNVEAPDGTKVETSTPGDDNMFKGNVETDRRVTNGE